MNQKDEEQKQTDDAKPTKPTGTAEPTGQYHEPWLIIDDEDCEGIIKSL
ncbi:MAG: hypothetical protein WC797_03865 [Candidatus Paceibacterota bacterium]